jgi:hypothetical protein
MTCGLMVGADMTSQFLKLIARKITEHPGMV